MPGVTHSNLGYGNIDALLTTTLANYQETLRDQIFDDYPLLSFINGKLGKKIRGESIKKVLQGGESIIEHLLYGTNSTVDSYSGAETLDTTLQEGMTQARFTWKQYSAAVGITGIEERSNKGRAAMINLLTAKTKQAEMSLKDRMNQDAFGDGTGNGSKNLTGLSAQINNSGTLGGINSSTYTWWKSTVTTGGSFASQGLDNMRSTINTITFGNDRPDMGITTQAVFEYFHKSIQPQERYTNTDVASVGFRNLSYEQVPILFDRDCTSGVMYFLNSKWLNFCVHEDADFDISPFVKPDNQDVRTAIILFQGNITTSNRRKLGKITNISA